MKISAEELNQRIARFKEGLRRSGVKLTHQRIEIFQELARSLDHPDADAIYRAVRRRVSTISLDTVYRTLAFLEELQLVRRVEVATRRARYDANAECHHHFLCSQCGTIYDVYSRNLDRLAPPPDIESLGEVERVQVQMIGTCSGCSKRSQNTNKQRLHEKLPR